MTVAEAAKVWEDGKRTLEKIDPGMKAAAEVLKEYFRTSGRNKRGKIGFALSSYLRIDTTLVKELLGDDVAKVQTRSQRETLSLLR